MELLMKNDTHDLAPRDCHVAFDRTGGKFVHARSINDEKVMDYREYCCPGGCRVEEEIFAVPTSVREGVSVVGQGDSGTGRFLCFPTKGKQSPHPCWGDLMTP
jgi:hypothetical protein